MDNNTRSYLSRFSGLLLFLLTLLVVGVLVVLTLRAAQDNDVSVDDASVNTASENQDFIIDGGNDVAVNPDVDADSGVTIVDGDADSGSEGVVATNDEDQNTDTNTVLGSTDADVDADADSEDDSEDDSEEVTPTVVAVAGGNGTDVLPNTGSELNAIVAIVVVAMVFAAVSSRRDLISSLR